MTIRFLSEADASAVFAAADTLTQDIARPILDLLSGGFEITWFQANKALGQGQWLALAKPDEDVGTHFGLTRECLVIGNGAPVDFEQAMLAQTAPEHVTVGIEPAVKFLASKDPLAETASSAWGLAKKIDVVLLKEGIAQGLSPSEVTEQLYRALVHSLWRRDLFDEADPVRLTNEFFGRDEVVAEIVARAMAGTSVAVLGLRKIGKSSVLRRVEDCLASDHTCLSSIASLDGSSARLRNRRWWHVAQDILDAWQASFQSRASMSGSRIQVHGRELRDLISKKVLDPARLASAFEHDVFTLAKASHALRVEMGVDCSRLVLILDECDQLYPHVADADHWREDFFALWNVLARVRQRLEKPAELIHIVACANPSGVEQGSLLGQPNPLFATPRSYLSPMTRKDAEALLCGLGIRMGLLFPEETVDRIFELVGGHPLLLRRIGSAIHSAEINRAGITTVSVQAAERAIKKHRRDCHNQVTWMLEHFSRVAPDEEKLLRDLVLGGQLAYENKWADEDLRETFAYNLERYGIVRFAGETPEVTFPLLKDALQKPAANEFVEQKRKLKDLVDAIEGTIRARITVDISEGKSSAEAVDAIAQAIPSDAKNRPRDRQALIDLGLAEGLSAILESMNWGDYEILLSKFYDVIQWAGPPATKDERLSAIKTMFRQAHLVRHNNDRELRELIRTEGFAGLFRRFCDVRDMLSA